MNGTVVHKNVRAAIIGGDESKSLFGIEPFHGTCEFSSGGIIRKRPCKTQRKCDCRSRGDSDGEPPGGCTCEEAEHDGDNLVLSAKTAGDDEGKDL